MSIDAPIAFRVEREPGIDAELVNGLAQRRRVDWREPSNDSGIIPAKEIRARFPELRPVVLEGLLRQGETMNVIGATKAGKSWLIHGLAVAISNGLFWMGREVSQGRVLIVDNELHEETLIDRAERVAAATTTDDFGEVNASTDQIDFLPLRGVAQDNDVFGICRRLQAVEPNFYRLICIDALYRALPPGTSESDNAQMMAVYNCLDRIARMTGAAIVLNHHATKGDQSTKAVTDVGSGAGSISRATDTHLIIRPHEKDDLCVMEAVTRSFPPPRPTSIRFEWPLWVKTGTEPKLKQPKGGRDGRQAAVDQETREKLRVALGQGQKTVAGLRTETGFGESRVLRGLSLLGGEVESSKKRKKSSQKIYLVYKLKEI